jgi:glycosyltransferase involved in cell wall biosynthesis
MWNGGGMAETHEDRTDCSPPRAVFGLPAYNHAHKLRKTLDSLLNQTEADFRLIVSDDGSTDETAAIVQDYARRDRRVIYTKTDRRTGYIGNAKRCFALARQKYPSTPYFAWASDHDIWHPRWLEVLANALDRHEEAVIACPNVYRIDENGRILAAKPARCTNVGEPISARQFARTFSAITPGDMIYGLIRAEALDKAGVLAWHLLPDRLTVMLLTFYGSVLSVPEYLWSRRYRGIASSRRQMRSSFLDGTPPYLYLPWWMTHAGHLFHKFAINPGLHEPVGRLSGAGYAALYALLGARHVFVRGLVHPAKRTLRSFAPASYELIKAKYRRAQKPSRH